MSSRDCSRVVISVFCFILCSFETLLKTSLCICSIWDFWHCYHIKKLIFTNFQCPSHVLWIKNGVLLLQFTNIRILLLLTLLFFFFVLSNHFCTLHIFFKFARCPPGVCTGAKSFHNLCKRYLSEGSIKRIFSPRLFLYVLGEI